MRRQSTSASCQTEADGTYRDDGRRIGVLARARVGGGAGATAGRRAPAGHRSAGRGDGPVRGRDRGRSPRDPARLRAGRCRGLHGRRRGRLVRRDGPVPPSAGAADTAHRADRGAQGSVRRHPRPVRARKLPQRRCPGRTDPGRISRPPAVRLAGRPGQRGPRRRSRRRCGGHGGRGSARRGRPARAHRRTDPGDRHGGGGAAGRAGAPGCHRGRPSRRGVQHDHVRRRALPRRPSRRTA